jgi:hypothetical protein
MVGFEDETRKTGQEYVTSPMRIHLSNIHVSVLATFFQIKHSLVRTSSIITDWSD